MKRKRTLVIYTHHDYLLSVRVLNATRGTTLVRFSLLGLMLLSVAALHASSC